MEYVLVLFLYFIYTFLYLQVFFETATLLKSYVKYAQQWCMKRIWRKALRYNKFL